MNDVNKSNDKNINVQMNIADNVNINCIVASFHIVRYCS